MLGPPEPIVMPVAPNIVHLDVNLIRPEEGLGRQRSREGHEQLQRSISQFGVLTPITVRVAPDGSGEYLLVKGQGRTLACRLLGLSTIPALVLSEEDGEVQKVQQFLVENVARLRMTSTDRALLMHRARQQGEETTEIARRFGVATATARRLLAQLEDASTAEVVALRTGRINLAIQAVVHRQVDLSDREAVMEIVAALGLRARELDQILLAVGWRELSGLGLDYQAERLVLLEWVCESFARESGSSLERLRAIAAAFPLAVDTAGRKVEVRRRGA